MIVFVVLVSLALYIFLKEFLLSSRNGLVPKPSKYTTHHYAVLIPARDESKVIEQLLLSIKKQTLPIASDDVYIIVEDKKDQTVAIAKKYKMNIIYRHDLTKRRKGYALDDAIKEILQDEKHYDAYFIFDADNVLDPHFFEAMTTSFDAGYDIGIGYRNTKNGNDSIYAAASSLTFSMINTLGNDTKSKYHKTLTISGTGFYIRGKWIEKWRGYPFHSLTEDYELTLYATLHDLTTTYNKKAIFYDEQPKTYQETIKQRTRWVRGYFDTRKMYIKELKQKLKLKDQNYASCYDAIMGVKPFILLVVSLLYYIFRRVYLIVLNLMTKKPIGIEVIQILVILFLVYVCMFLVTLMMLEKEERILNLKPKMKIKVAIYNPIFLASYVTCLIRAFSKKEIAWEKITHDQILTIEKGK